MRLWLYVILLAASLAVAGPIPVVNPGFETGDFSGWTRSGNLGFTVVTSDPRTAGLTVPPSVRLAASVTSHRTWPLSPDRPMM
jgi:hypothetical protein